MRKTFHPHRISEAIANSQYKHMLESMPIKPYLISYKVGDFAITPDSHDKLLQIVVSGALSIYYVRDDGSRFSLAILEKDTILGESHLFDLESQDIYAQAIKPLTCLAIDISQNKDTLMNSSEFLRVIAKVQAIKIHAIASQDASSGTLRDRVLSYMRYKCQDGQLKGLEKAAFHLHCSSRQLQRILNDFEKEGVVKKVYKGTYDLCKQ